LPSSLSVTGSDKGDSVPAIGLRGTTRASRRVFTTRAERLARRSDCMVMSVLTMRMAGLRQTIK
jgi:hypothetical protein